MIDLLFIALMQAAAGEPAPAPAPATEATSAGQAQPADQQATPAQAARRVMRCRREPVTGTHLSRKICMTDAQRQQLENDSREQLQQMQRPAGTNGN